MTQMSGAGNHRSRSPVMAAGSGVTTRRPRRIKQRGAVPQDLGNLGLRRYHHFPIPARPIFFDTGLRHSFGTLISESLP